MKQRADLARDKHDGHTGGELPAPSSRSEDARGGVVQCGAAQPGRAGRRAGGDRSAGQAVARPPTGLKSMRKIIRITGGISVTGVDNQIYLMRNSNIRSCGSGSGGH